MRAEKDTDTGAHGRDLLGEHGGLEEAESEKVEQAQVSSVAFGHEHGEPSGLAGFSDQFQLPRFRGMTIQFRDVRADFAFGFFMAGLYKNGFKILSKKIFLINLFLSF